MDVIVDCYGGLNPFLLRVGRFDTVGKIKEKIEQLQGIPFSTQTICFNNEILPDHFNVGNSGIVDGSTLHLLPADDDVDLNLPRLLNRLRLTDSDISRRERPEADTNIPIPTPNPNTHSRRPARRQVPSMRVVVKHNEERIWVAVSREEPVSVLKGRVRHRGFRLPHPCFFIHRRRVMEEDQSFAMNEVRHGDLIESFRGRIAAGDSDTDAGQADSNSGTSVPSTSSRT